MNTDHLVRVGLLGAIGRFRSVERRSYPRDTEVVCRTARGLEVGTVLCPLATAQASQQTPAFQSDGTLLRQLGREDRLMQQRLERFRDRAFQACTRLLNERGSPAILVDVEHLFDGKSLYFYFLGPVDPELEQLTSELAATYQQKVKFKKFSETLVNGCGPNCGTEESKCSSGGCGSCAIQGGCSSRQA